MAKHQLHIVEVSSKVIEFITNLRSEQYPNNWLVEDKIIKAD